MSMTVRDLVTKLQSLKDQDMKVHIEDEEDDDPPCLEKVKIKNGKVILYYSF